jgi:hypothetical protein
MNIVSRKLELIQWINSLSDESVLDQVFAIKSGKTVVRDFDKEWDKSLPINEAREKSHDYIKSLPWKK